MSDSQTVAKTILEQLGGNGFIRMTGAYNLMSHKKEEYHPSFRGERGALSFRFKGSSKANHLKITLTAIDDYTLEFTKIRGLNFTTVEKVEGVYSDNLQEVFTRVTGLYTHL